MRPEIRRTKDEENPKTEIRWAGTWMRSSRKPAPNSELPASARSEFVERPVVGRSMLEVVKLPTRIPVRQPDGDLSAHGSVRFLIFRLCPDVESQFSGFRSACPTSSGSDDECFTPCMGTRSLLEAVLEAARRTTPGDVVQSFHPLVRASINFETTYKADCSFVQ